MTGIVKNIFEHNIELLGDMDKAVYYFRKQQYDKALSLLAHSIDGIKLVIETLISNREYFNRVEIESMLEMLKGILAAKQNGDFILLADLLELQLMNLLIQIQELIMSKEDNLFNDNIFEENIQLLLERQRGFVDELKVPIDPNELLAKGYRVEFTSCGLMTLAAKNDNKEFYFHTNNRIKSEAFLLARNWYQEGKKRYILYGFGMGYHIYELMLLAKDAEIEVYEGDRNVIMLACAFSDLKQLLVNKGVNIIYDPELESLSRRITKIKQEESLIIHYPSYMNIRNRKGKEILRRKLTWLEAIESC